MTTTQIKFAAVCIAFVAVASVASWGFHSYRVSRLMQAAAEAEKRSKASEISAAEAEQRAAAYAEKITYLEAEIAQIGEIARRQDEEISKTKMDTSRARSDVERARNTRASGATERELCEKLAALGHACR